MEEDLANLKLLDEEEEAFQEEAVLMDRSYQFCLVGQCLTDSVVHFSSLHNTMADLWHPIGGICITDLRDKKEVLGFIRGYVRELNLCKEKMEVFCDSLPNEVWRPPKLGFIKLNFDATFQSNSKTSSTIVLARDSEGKVVGAETYLFTDVVDAFVVEARA
ncbi:hypothetical protein PVK06_034292 [Gossypium arboreum]|uniref:DUF4283 domain-containing protein n=1 Tax=Gossypium arboreum TaxID=29729 RepID=A0ABR0NDU5_GOSAR|nr:hypothetical protein PVK06_034292 [Gossypium arboreum]